MAVTPRRFWLPEEDQVIARHARALVAGRYERQRAAALACLADLGRLYKSIKRPVPPHHPAVKGRDRAVVEDRLRKFLVDQGLTWSGAGFREAEHKIVRRRVRDLFLGRFPDARRAAEACIEDMRRLPPQSRPVRPRSLHTVHCHVLAEAHRTRQPWSSSKWSREEDEVARRFGNALAGGEYASARKAAVACRQELARRLGRSAAGRRSLVGIEVRLTRWAHRKGWDKFHAPWSADEYAVMDRYLRALHEGRYANAKAAAADCARQLAVLHGRTSRRLPLRRGQVSPRTVAATWNKMALRAASLHLPRTHAAWTKAETDIVVKYARAVDSGRLPSWRAAARACLPELERLYAVAGRGSPIHARQLAGRRLAGVHGKFKAVANQLGLRSPAGTRIWSPEEGRVFQQWLRWYDRYRSSPHRLGPTPLATAVSGLQEELEEKGFSRTMSACRSRLKDGWLLMHGLAQRRRRAPRASGRRQGAA